MGLTDYTISDKRYWQAGVDYERKRIIALLKPLAECTELCEYGCYPEDCSAPSYAYAIKLIEKGTNEQVD